MCHVPGPSGSRFEHNADAFLNTLQHREMFRIDWIYPEWRRCGRQMAKYGEVVRGSAWG